MKLDFDHVAAFVALALLAFELGRRQALKHPTTAATAAAASLDAGTVTAPAQWWSYAGSWQL